MSSLSKSVQLDVRLMLSGFTVMLVSFMVISIHIGLSKLRVNQRHTLDLPSLVVGLQASYNEKGSLFRSVSSLLYTYKSNSFYRLLRRKHKSFLSIITKNARIGYNLIGGCKIANASLFQRLLIWIKHQYPLSFLDQRRIHQKAHRLCGLKLLEVDGINNKLHYKLCYMQIENYDASRC